MKAHFTRMRALAVLGLLLVCNNAFANANDPPGLRAMVTEKAVQHGVPVALAHGVVRTESGYRCGARGSAGERGIMQVKPATARMVGVTGNLFDCATGLEAGLRYLRQALALTRGNQALAATLYNRGLGARPRVTAYSRRVMGHAARFEKGAT